MISDLFPRTDDPGFRNVIVTLCVMIVAVVSARPVQAQDYEAKSQRVDSLYAEYGPETPGISIRVMQDGRVVHSGDYGMANLEYGVPITPSTVFPIGSNSKQFTGMAIAMLADQGKLDLDADIRDYLTFVPDFGETITIRHLLHHASGIRDWVRPFAWAGMRARDAVTVGQVTELVRQERELNSRPGERYTYSNTGYVLLAAVVEQVTGMSFPEWMREHIFEPLAMSNTRVRPNWYYFQRNIASSYYPVGGRYIAVPNGLAAYGSCCILSTTDDFLKWARNYETAQVGGSEVIRRMRADTIGIQEYDGRLVGYGYGLNVLRWRGHTGFYHSGQWTGHRSAFVQIPDRGLTVVVLGNAGPSTDLKEFDVLDIYLDIQDDVTSTESTQAAAHAGRTLAEMAVQLNQETLDRYVGSYDVGRNDGPSSSEIARIWREGDHLLMQFTTDREPVTLTAISSTEFMYRLDRPVVRFDVGESGRATDLVWRDRQAPRVVDFRPSPEELAEFTGAYYSPELEITLRFEVENGVLVARHIRWGDALTFTPTLPDEFRASAEITKAHFVRESDGGVDEVIVSGQQALNVRFQRLMLRPM